MKRPFFRRSAVTSATMQGRFAEGRAHLCYSRLRDTVYFQPYPPAWLSTLVERGLVHEVCSRVGHWRNAPTR